MAKLTLVADGITQQLEGYVKRANALEGYLNRVVVEQYRNIQRTRWMTEGASEGKQWDPLSPRYSAWKRVHYKSYPGAGTRMLVATGRLQKGVIGMSPDFRKVTTPRSLTISTAVEYAEHVNEARSFTTYSTKSLKEILTGINKFLLKNQIRIPKAF